MSLRTALRVTSAAAVLVLACHWAAQPWGNTLPPPSAATAPAPTLPRPVAQGERAETAPGMSTLGDGLRPARERQESVRQLALALAGDPRQDLRAAILSLRQQCDTRGRNPCLDALLAQLPAEQRARMQDILTKLPQLEARLSELRLSTQQPLLERMDAVRALRREVMGQENAALLFGREESYQRYQAALDQFLQHGAADLPLEQRLHTADSMRARELANYVQSGLREGEERDLRYQAELPLTLLDARTDAERQTLTRAVRGRYFDAEQVQQMARNDAFDAQQAQRATQYATEKQAILGRFSNPGDASGHAQRDAELLALRQRLFPDSRTP